MTIGRLVLDDPEKMDEGTGEAVDHLGAMPVPATRAGRKVKLGLHTLDAAFVDTVAARQTIRRQLRSLVNNRGWTLTGIYVSSTTDPEWDGWYVPEPADLTIAENGGDAVGWYRLDLSAYRVGLNRTHRPATIVRVMDVTAATAPRDLLRTDYSTDFDGMTARPEVSIPYTASGIKVSGAKTLSRASRGPLRGGGYLTL
ncbi:MAG: hypothetical protein KC461_14860, partial [Dehalococcoidia bacterium]|nr:hypothetical protein [Dehalococcoidia bacterium]